MRDRYSTSYDPASLFRGRSSNFNMRSEKIGKRIGMRPPALHATLEVSQSCFVLDAVNFES